MKLRAQHVRSAWDATNGFLWALVLLALLAGCVVAPSRAVEGAQVDPPAGYVEWCEREPWQAACGGALSFEAWCARYPTNAQCTGEERRARPSGGKR